MSKVEKTGIAGTEEQIRHYLSYNAGENNNNMIQTDGEMAINIVHENKDDSVNMKFTITHNSAPASAEKFRGIKKDKFVTSLYISAHPLIRSRKKTKQLYFAALEYLVNLCASNIEYTKARLLQYHDLLVNTETAISRARRNINKTIKDVVDDFIKPWKRNRCLMLLCDIALIVTDKTAVKKALDIIAKYLSHRRQKRLKELFEILYNDKMIPSAFAVTKDMIKQFRANRNFASQKEIKVIVTATMSAGKSTLINAIVGKRVTRTSQEACTNNLCFLFNKPFEDNCIHLLASPLNLDAAYDDIITAEKEYVCNIASFFRASGHSKARVCLIDTPGVNSAINRNHGKLTHKAITEETYDKLIYVLNANMLGTDDEIKHLKYVFNNVPNEKVIFVLNKLDDFKKAEDSISESIEGVKRDLQKIGYKNPVICPLSAYFSLLLKMKQNNEELSENEQDVFDLYVKKFSRPEYDLSLYYDKNLADETRSDDKLIKMNLKSGLYGFENILYGETKK
jgi:predicted GTPase